MQYYVERADGDCIGGPWDAYSTAHEMLTYDGHRFEIRKEGGVFELYVSETPRGRLSRWPDYWGISDQAVFQNVIDKGGVLNLRAVEAMAAG